MTLIKIILKKNVILFYINSLGQPLVITLEI